MYYYSKQNPNAIIIGKLDGYTKIKPPKEKDGFERKFDEEKNTWYYQEIIEEDNDINEETSDIGGTSE